MAWLTSEATVKIPKWASSVVLNKENVQHINPFNATGLFLYPLKTSENLLFSDVFREYRKGPLHEMG